eukprot:EG_transcript_51006
MYGISPYRLPDEHWPPSYVPDGTYSYFPGESHGFVHDGRYLSYDAEPYSYLAASALPAGRAAANGHHQPASPYRYGADGEAAVMSADVAKRLDLTGAMEAKYFRGPPGTA